MTNWTLTSPDGTVGVELMLVDGSMSYRVDAFGTEVVSRSAMGVARADANLAEGLSLLGVSDPIRVDMTYDMIHGKRSSGRLEATAMTVNLRGLSGDRLEIDVIAANGGAAFRYRFPENVEFEVRVTGENTTFSIPEGGRAWLQPTQLAGHHAPAYENSYSDGIPVGTMAPIVSWNMPALFEVGNTWVLLAESDLDETYVGGHIRNNGTGSSYQMVLPQPSEGMGVGDVEPLAARPWTLPWRVIIAGRSASEVADSDLVNALARPPEGDFSWVRPGRVSWSWWSEHDSPKDLERLRTYVDLAADMGWEYTLVDANWNEHSDREIAELVAYARARGVGVFLWYNSGGANNEVTEEPRDRMADPDVRAAEMDKLVEWGVAGIKVDFFHSDKQAGIEQYLGIIRDAAARKLLVNFHGSTVPRGWSRTWPHLMTMEAVRGAEQYGFDPQYPEVAGWHNTILPFTRNVVGPMDYTPVTFGDQVFAHATTNAHELALSVVFESGLLHLADSEASYRGLPGAVTDLLRTVPASWDETRFLGGVPGDNVVVARRSGADWYLAGISGLNDDRVLEVDTSWLIGRHALIVQDGADAKGFAVREEVLGDGLALRLAPRGGFMVRVTP